MKLNTIVRFLNKELNVRKIPDISRNGLQVRGKADVKRIAFGVDACMELFEKAKAKNCDLVVVHHGLLWKPRKREEVLTKRINYLKKNKMSLYGVHAPLDNNINYGHNVNLAELIGAKNLKKFGYFDKVYWGYSGTIKPISLRSVVSKLDRKLKTKSIVLGFGKKMIRKVGFGSGSCGFAIEEAKKKKLDLFITGEIKHGNYHIAKELKMNIIAAGHYATETSSVKALMPLLKQKFNIETIFIDIPTGL